MSRRQVKLQDGTTITAGIPDGEYLWSEHPSEFGAPYLIRFVPRDNSCCRFGHGVFLYLNGSGRWYIVGDVYDDGFIFVSHSPEPSFFIGKRKMMVTTVDGKTSIPFEFSDTYQVAEPPGNYQAWSGLKTLKKLARKEGWPLLKGSQWKKP